MTGSNRRPSPCKGAALPAELIARTVRRTNPVRAQWCGRPPSAGRGAAIVKRAVSPMRTQPQRDDEQAEPAHAVRRVLTRPLSAAGVGVRRCGSPYARRVRNGSVRSSTSSPMLRPRLRASRLSVAWVCGVTVNDMWTRATRPMNGRPPFRLPVRGFAGLFFAAVALVFREPVRVCVAIATPISDRKPRILFAGRKRHAR
jgi:hypothetical protein